MMIALDEAISSIWIASNKGYGSAAHMAALREYGPCPLHREPLSRQYLWLESDCTDREMKDNRMNKRKTGTEYEELAARWLTGKGFEILEKNYRCRIGEIDLIARDVLSCIFWLLFGILCRRFCRSILFRQTNQKFGIFALFAAHRNLCLVQTHNVFGDVQSDAQPRFVVASGVIRLIKAFKNFR